MDVWDSYRLTSVPAGERYAAALSRLPVTAVQRRLLLAQSALRGRQGTTHALARGAGLPNYRVVHSQYGRLGHEVADFLGLQPPTYGQGRPLWSAALSEIFREPPDDEWVLRLYPEVADAVAVLSAAWNCE